MKNRNICKFIPESSADKLEINAFIFESDHNAMLMKQLLTLNLIILVKKGNVTFHFDNTSTKICPGTLIFGFEGEQFYAESNDDCEYMYISFGGIRANTLFNRFGISRQNRIFAKSDGLIPIWHESLSRASKENVDLAAEGILLYTFSRFSGTLQENDDLINKIIGFSEENFTDCELSLHSIAETFSYNPKYLSHTFKEKMGIGYSEYLRNLRIKYAISLLDHGIDSIKNIAALSGFSDPLYFSSVFKKTVGKSPNEYKNTKNH